MNLKVVNVLVVTSSIETDDVERLESVATVMFLANEKYRIWNDFYYNFLVTTFFEIF